MGDQAGPSSAGRVLIDPVQFRRIRSVLTSLEQYRQAQLVGWNPYLLSMATQEAHHCLRCGERAFAGVQRQEGPILWYCLDHLGVSPRPYSLPPRMIYDEAASFTERDWETLTTLFPPHTPY